MLFDPKERAAWSGFLVTYALLDRAIDDDLRASDGVTHTEFEVLLRLRFADGGRMRIQALAADSILTRSGTSRLVARLEREGLVRREDVPGDGRGSFAVLTAEGAARFDAAAERHVEFVRSRFHGRLTDDELETLATIWHKLHD